MPSLYALYKYQVPRGMDHQRCATIEVDHLAMRVRLDVGLMVVYWHAGIVVVLVIVIVAVAVMAVMVVVVVAR